MNERPKKRLASSCHCGIRSCGTTNSAAGWTPSRSSASARAHHPERFAQALLPRQQPRALDQHAREVLDLEGLEVPADPAVRQRSFAAGQAVVGGDLAQHPAHRLDVVGIQAGEVAGVGQLEVLEQVGDLLGLLVEGVRADRDLQQLADLPVLAQLLLARAAGVDPLAVRDCLLGADRQLVALAGDEAALAVSRRAEDRIEVVQIAEPLLRADRVVGDQLTLGVRDHRLDASDDGRVDGQDLVGGGELDRPPLARVVGEVGRRLAVEPLDVPQLLGLRERELREGREPDPQPVVADRDVVAGLQVTLARLTALGVLGVDGRPRDRVIGRRLPRVRGPQVVAALLAGVVDPSGVAGQPVTGDQRARRRIGVLAALVGLDEERDHARQLDAVEEVVALEHRVDAERLGRLGDLAVVAVATGDQHALAVALEHPEPEPERLQRAVDGLARLVGPVQTERRVQRNAREA